MGVETRQTMTTPHLLIFGLGYSAMVLARRVGARGWTVASTTRDGRNESIAYADRDAVLAEIRRASHILSTVPPDTATGDAVLNDYGGAIAVAPATWVGYLSSTGVYGDTGGAWVDEGAPVKGRRAERNAADAAWQTLRGDVRVFRLPGIYGPGRSAVDRVRWGTAQLVDVSGQVFSRIHVEDIARAIVASFACDAVGIFNIADDLPAEQNDVVRFAARLTGVAEPQIIGIDALSSAARAFYAENRRVANGRAKRLLGWAPRYPDYRSGLISCL